MRKESNQKWAQKFVSILVTSALLLQSTTATVLAQETPVQDMLVGETTVETIVDPAEPSAEPTLDPTETREALKAIEPVEVSEIVEPATMAQVSQEPDATLVSHATWADAATAAQSADANPTAPDYVVTVDTASNSTVVHIKTALGFAKFANTQEFLSAGATVYLDADIDLRDAGVVGYTQAEVMSTGANSWAMLSAFSATFDGQGHTVSGVYCNADTANAGLFPYVKNGSVKNVIVNDSEIKTTSGYISDLQAVGGVIGYYETTQPGTYEISGCATTSTVSVSGFRRVGGVVGIVDVDSGIPIAPATVTIDRCVNSATAKASGSNGQVGGIVGAVRTGPSGQATVQNCYNTAIVEAYSEVGGIAGYLYDDCTVQACYNTAQVKVSSSYAGGIAGKATGTIKQCYTIGELKRTGYWLTNCGPVVGGANGSLAVTDCYYDSDVVSIDELTSTYGTGLTTAQMTGTTDGDATNTETDRAQDSMTGFDASVWTFGVDALHANEVQIIQHYPVLTANVQSPAPFGLKTGLIDTWEKAARLAQEGKDYFLSSTQLTIQSAIGLAYFAQNYASYPTHTISIARDINLDDGTVEGYGPDGTVNWIPIGDKENGHQFTGQVISSGKRVISGLYINTTEDYQGLFGYTNASAIKNISIENSSIKGGNYVGAIVGYANYSMENCSNNGTVQGAQFVGGIAGAASSMYQCYNTGDVTATKGIVGGLAGETWGGCTKCYNTGAITTTQDCAGGITGNIVSGFVIDCYNTGAVTGAQNVGGIIGQTKNASNSFTYNTGAITATNNAGGIIGNFSTMETFISSYNIGTIVCDGASYGGIIGAGRIDDDNANTCYYLDDSVNATGANAYGIPLTTMQMTGTTDNDTENTATDRAQDSMSEKYQWRWIFTDDADTSHDAKKACSYPVLVNLKQTPAPSKVLVVKELENWAEAAELAEPEIDYTLDATNKTIAIHTALGLAYLSQNVANGITYEGYHVSLTGNIDLLDANVKDYNAQTIMADGYAGGNSWPAIGTESYYPDKFFRGDFDGANHTVSNVYINEPEQRAQGLFGVIAGSVQNVFVTQAEIIGQVQVGGVVGYAYKASVANCTSHANVRGTLTVGGVVGSAQDTSVINCTNYGHVYGAGGGVVGFLYDASITGCVNHGAVESTSNNAPVMLGGIVGEALNGTIKDCYNNGAINATQNGQSVGGIVGCVDADSDSAASVSTSYNTATVSGINNVGGIVGTLRGNAQTAENPNAILNACYNTGNVSGTANVGGVVGISRKAQITDVYNIGAVSGTTYVGAVIGTASDQTTATNCYTDSEVTGDLPVVGSSATDATITQCTARSTPDMTGNDSDKPAFATPENWIYTDDATVGDATTYYYPVIANNTQVPTPSVTKMTAEITLAMQGWTYGTTASEPVATVTKGDGTAITYVYYNNVACTDAYKLAQKPTDVGTYYVVATVASTKGYLSATSTPQSFAIAYATVADGSYTTSGTDWVNAYAVTATEGYLVGLSETGPFVQSIDITAETAVADKATGTEFTFYIKAESDGAVAKETVLYKLDKTAPSITSITGNPSAWTNQDTAISVAHTDVLTATSVSVTCDGAPITVTNDAFTATQNGTYVVTVTDAAGNTAVQNVVVSYIDKVAPTANITIKGNVFRQFLNAITFNMFFKNTVDVNIDCDDALSGYESIESQIVKKGATYNPDAGWMPYTSYTVGANVQFSVYAKIIDNAGNMVIINSDGVTVYTDSVAETNSFSFTKSGNDTDKAVTVTTNGNTVKSITLNGTAIAETSYTVGTEANGKTVVTFTKAYLATLTRGANVFTISYLPMGTDNTGATSDSDAPNTTTVTANVFEAITDTTTQTQSTSYNATAQSPSVPTATVVGNETLTVLYSTDQGATYTESTVPSFTTSGAYTVYYQLSANNHITTTGTIAFTITKVQLAWTASTVSDKVYDGTATATVATAPTLSGVVTGDTAPAITVGTATFASANVGKQAVTATGYVMADDANYIAPTAQPAFADASITAKEITITPSAQSKYYGEDDTTITYTSSDVVQGETISVSGAIAREVGEAIGTYALNLGTLSLADNGAFLAGNYTLTLAEGIVYTINEYTTDAKVENITDWQSVDTITFTAPEGYTIATVNGVDDTFTDTITVEATDGENVAVTYYLRSETGAISTAKTVTYNNDRVAPVIQGVEPNKSYSADVTINVIDDHIDTVTLNGSDEDSTFTVRANGNQTYTVVAIDKAGHTAQVTFFVYEPNKIDTAIEVLKKNETQLESTIHKAIANDFIQQVISGVDKENAKNDEKQLATLTNLEQLLLQINGNITTVPTKVVFATEVLDVQKAVIGDITPNGLALAVCGTGIPQDNIEFSLAVAQLPSTLGEWEFDVKPMRSINGTEKTVVPNAEIKTPVSFPLYLNDSFATKYCSIEHVKADGTSTILYNIPIDTDTVGKYVPVTVSEFSTFIIREQHQQVVPVSPSTGVVYMVPVWTLYVLAVLLCAMCATCVALYRRRKLN